MNGMNIYLNIDSNTMVKEMHSWDASLALNKLHKAKQSFVEALEEDLMPRLHARTFDKEFEQFLFYQQEENDNGTYGGSSSSSD